MDSAQQHTAVIREGDPSQPRANNPESKVDAAEPATAHGDTAQEASKKSLTKTQKAKAGAKPSEGAKTNKGGKKAKKPTNDDGSDDESLDSSEGDAGESSDEDSDGHEHTAIDKSALRKHAGAAKKPTKQSLDSQKLKSHKAPVKLSNKEKSGSRLSKASRTVGKAPQDDESSESDWDSSDTEDESDEDGEIPATKQKGKGSSSTKDDLSNVVARELQRLLQQVQTPVSAHPGLDPPLGYSQGRPAFDAYHGSRALPSHSSRSHARGGGLGNLLGDREGGDLFDIPSRRRPGNSQTDKHRNGDIVDAKKSKSTDFKRVDQVWDSAIHNYKLQTTAESSSETKRDGCCFHVRRTFDWEGKYKQTWVDIRSKSLRECLQTVIGNIKGVSLVDEIPKLDPNMLFLYLEDLRTHVKTLKKEIANVTGSKKERKEEIVRLEEKRKQLKVLVRYIDKDYAKIKASLNPMLEHGLITFDLVWALWKPETLAYTTTYGSQDEPRVFKVDTAEKHYSMTKGTFYLIDGKYLEFDGKKHGYGTFVEDISEFRGAKKITSLSCYPLKYRKDEAQLREKLITRGKKFVSLGGVNYTSHHGLAYYKKKKAIVKVNVNGRIMVDPAIHRRINPNYPISLVRPKEDDLLNLSDDEESDEDEDEDMQQGKELEDGVQRPKLVIKSFKDDKGRTHIAAMTKDEADELNTEKLTEVENGTEETMQPSDDEQPDSAEEKTVPQFTEEEYLIASPVVLGFSFGEKLWLEFTVSGIKDISWNDHAYDSLVLEPKTKETVKALVESHKYHAAESIDDVIQGKGKGLVVVLHGPPGTGKTLTAEGISELLKCPLYMVSAGELGTDSRVLETELQRILDVCHAWGAILLLDEADVFLEKRNMADIHRNALVSIFLRQLEYFQGILFLTTNRVETFDDAFQSRIHIALRYDALDQRAKKTIFKMFVERARAQQKADKDSIAFTDADYDGLARHDLNGRQIKNTVIRAQALAVNKHEPLSMVHVRQILDVQIDFQKDLKGGTGYQDAMRSYF